MYIFFLIFEIQNAMRLKAQRFARRSDVWVSPQAKNALKSEIREILAEFRGNGEGSTNANNFW